MKFFGSGGVESWTPRILESLVGETVGTEADRISGSWSSVRIRLLERETRLPGSCDDGFEDVASCPPLR